MNVRGATDHVKGGGRGQKTGGDWWVEKLDGNYRSTAMAGCQGVSCQSVKVSKCQLRAALNETYLGLLYEYCRLGTQ
jgi:hypothetical protein